jgi:hypothetical protein
VWGRGFQAPELKQRLELWRGQVSELVELMTLLQFLMTQHGSPEEEEEEEFEISRWYHSNLYTRRYSYLSEKLRSLFVNQLDIKHYQSDQTELRDYDYAKIFSEIAKNYVYGGRAICWLVT